MNATELILIVTTALLLIYDGLVGVFGQPTESRVLLSTAFNWVTVPMAFGILLGHWFWPHKQPPQLFSSLLSLNLGPLPFLLISLIFDLVYNHYNVGGSHPWWRFPGFYTLIGIPIGSIFWYQINSLSIL